LAVRGGGSDALPFPEAYLPPAGEAAWGEGQRGRVWRPRPCLPAAGLAPRN